MALPVVNIDINYEDEKGALPAFFTAFFPTSGCHADKIQEFLSSYVSKDKDIARGIADIDINNDDDAPSVGRSLKYMEQLVRVPSLSPFFGCQRLDITRNLCRLQATVQLRTLVFDDPARQHAMYAPLLRGLSDAKAWPVMVGGRGRRPQQPHQDHGGRPIGSTMKSFATFMISLLLKTWYVSGF